MLPSNITKLKLLPCKVCKGWNYTLYDTDECEDHWVERHPNHYTHFLIRGQWYISRQRFIVSLLSLVEVDDAMAICGRLDDPAPTRIDSLTDLLTLARKYGCTEEQLKEVFPSKQVERMRGRVFKRIVRSK